MIMMDVVKAKQLDLFALEESAVSVFQIIPDEANAGNLRAYIEFSGGIVLDPKEDDPYKIPILDADWYLNVKKTSLPKLCVKECDVFLPAFIYDCYTKERMVDLNKYRYGVSSFSVHDANKILRRELRWKDLKAGPTKNPLSNTTLHHVPSKQNIVINGNGRCDGNIPNRKDKERVPAVTIDESDTSDSNDFPGTPTRGVRSVDRREPAIRSPAQRNRVISSNSDSGSDFSVETLQDRRSDSKTTSSFVSAFIRHIGESHHGETTKDSENRKRLKLQKRPYKHVEGQAILDYIFENDLYSFTGGNQMWQKMEKEQVVEGRTFQSLKEHFRKHVCKHLDSFKFTAEQSKKLERGMKQKGRGKRHQVARR